MDTKGFNPPIDLEIEPCEEERVLYLRVAPPVKGGAPRGMVYFTLAAKNNTDKALEVDKLTVSFPGTTLDPYEFPRAVTIEPGQTAEIGLKAGDDNKGIVVEQIQLDEFPPEITVTLDVPGLPGGTVSRTWDLGPHEKSYDFFMRPEKGDFGEYVVLRGKHASGGGSQHFGQDVFTKGWNAEGKLAGDRTGSSTNEDAFVWERPIYAMADGTVVHAIAQHPDNPAPHRRAFYATNLGKEYETAFPVSDIAAATLSKTRMVLAVLKENGQLHLTALDQDAAGQTLTPLGTAVGPAGEEVSIVGIDSSRVLVALRQGDQSELSLWKVAKDAITKTDTVTLADVAAVKVVNVLTTGGVSYVATVARTSVGTLAIDVWPVTGDTFHAPKPHASATAGPIGAFDAMRLDTPGRLATAVRAQNGTMKVIVWDLEFEGGQGGGGSEGDDITVANCVVTRRGDASTFGTVSEIAMANTRGTDRIATAVRTQTGTMKLIVWQVDPEGDVTRKASMEEAGAASLVALAMFKKVTLLSAFRTGSGTLRCVAWEVKEAGGVVTIEREFEQNRGATDMIATATMDIANTTVVTAVRTAAGTAKVIAWQFTVNNLIRILHGDEMVLYAHVRQGSVPEEFLGPDGTDGPVDPPYRPVKKGDLIGLVGNVGSAGGPHVHIHAQKVRPELLEDIEKLVEAVRRGDDVGPFRPLQFHGVLAMKDDGVKPGWMNNPMSEMNAEGAYFDDYVVWPWTGAAPGCGVVSGEIAELERLIAELDAQIADLQGELRPDETGEAAGPATKPYLFGRIKQLQAQRNAYRDELDALLEQARHLGCR